jgi:ATP-dependent DNA helicase RecG
MLTRSLKSAGRAVSRRYRKRRIGEFLKELELTEGRSTGPPKILKAMRANGSPLPVIEVGDERSSCVVRLPVHPLARGPAPEVIPKPPEAGRIVKLLTEESSDN